MDQFRNHIDDAGRNLTQLRQHSDKDSPYASLMQFALQELDTSLEELRVADEEMRAQNEQLATARDDVKAWQYYYRDLFEFAPDGYVVTDMQGTIREANQAAVALLHIASRFLRGKPLANYIVDEQRQFLRDRLLELQQIDGRKEWDIRLKPRHQPALDASLTVAVIKDTHGERVGLRWLIRDATARKEAEEARYRRLVQNVKDYAIFTLDTEGRILTWNDGAERITGYSEADVVGRRCSLLFTPEDIQRGLPEQEMQQAAAQGRVEEQNWMVRKDGMHFWCDGVLTALRNADGTVHSYAKVMRDFTERKRTEDERKRAETHLAQAYEREHHIAAAFQRAMLPEIPQDRFPGLSIATFYQAAWMEAQVGGDFFDAFALADGRVALVVGDVSGKGLAAGLYASELKSALRLILREDTDPGRALSRLNRFVCDRERLDDQHDNVFVTIALAIIQPVNGTLEVCVAGAEPPLILREAGPEILSAGDLMLGVQPVTEYQVSAVTLEHGDIFLAVTDGITDARNGNRFLDYQGLIDLTTNARRQESLPTLAQAILEGARTFAGGRFHDDVCLLLARCDACRL